MRSTNKVYIMEGNGIDWEFTTERNRGHRDWNVEKRDVEYKKKRILFSTYHP
jgi:hypothetical protein